jgi:tyrosyl-tRNA synthetase
MGKTEKGAVWLDPAMLSPFDYYQYWISVDDRDVRKLMLLFTDLELDEIDTLCRAQGAALRAVKARLAFEATKLAHGDDPATAAQTAAAQAFGDGEDWSAVPAVELGQSEVRLLDLVVHEQIAAFASKRQARERIAGGAVRIDGEVCKDPNRTLAASDFTDQTVRLQAGKKRRYRVLLLR